jgi:hypothetical protein
VAESEPSPARGTDTMSARPPATAVTVTGSRSGRAAEASRARAARDRCIAGLVRSPPATTISAGAGRPGNAAEIRSRVRTTGMLLGRSIGGLPIRMPTAGAASASRASVAAPPHTSGFRTTRRTSPAHSRDGCAAVRLRPRTGIRQRSAHSPISDSTAGSSVSAAATAMPVTMIVPTAIPVNRSTPVRNRPASEIITVTPETTMARPEVAAAIRSASPKDLPAARSSRSRRR